MNYVFAHELTSGTGRFHERLGGSGSGHGVGRVGHGVVAARLGRHPEQTPHLALDTPRPVRVQERRQQRVEQNSYQRQVISVGREASHTSLG